MLKKVLVLVLGFLFIVSAAFAYDLPKVYKRAYTADQPASTLITPTSGYKVVISNVAISAGASGAGSVYIFDSADTATTAITPTVVLANNGFYQQTFNPPMPASSVGSVIKYTSGSGAVGSIWIEYTEQQN